ncbi:MAG: hypothetical protein HWE23_16920 [Rhodobacteraceae bacterium]|nr:hypothetical protein [Paracoccaceae bacterium]
MNDGQKPIKTTPEANGVTANKIVSAGSLNWHDPHLVWAAFRANCSIFCIFFLLISIGVISARAEDSEKIDDGYYKLELYKPHGHFAVFKDPREGLCILRFISSSRPSQSKLFSLMPYDDDDDGNANLELTITAHEEEFVEVPNLAKTAVAVDEGRAMGPSTHALSDDRHNYYFLFRQKDVRDFKDQFKAGKSLVINVPGVYIGEISLRGSTKAVGFLNACNDEISRAASLTADE